jgi:hypothetical protein
VNGTEMAGTEAVGTHGCNLIQMLAASRRFTQLRFEQAADTETFIPQVAVNLPSSGWSDVQLQRPRFCVACAILS